MGENKFHAFDLARVSDEPSLLSKACYDLGSLHLNFDEFPQEDFDYLIGLIQSPEMLQKCEGIWHVILLFQMEWDMLTEEQKNKLQEVLELIFPKVQDDIASLLIPELLAENLGTPAALSALERLADTESDMRQAQVAHGFEHFIARTKDASLASRACKILGRIADRNSITVQKVACSALSRLRAKGLCK